MALWLAYRNRGIVERGDAARDVAEPGQFQPALHYVEYVTCYLDDRLTASETSGYPALVRDGFLSAAEAEAVAAFHTLLEAYKPPGGNVYDHKAILDDPNWRAVVSEARSAKTHLLELIKEPVEIEALTRVSPLATTAAEDK